jgi:hypothetical protein
MISNFNYTGRRKINLSRIEITLTREADGVRVFDARVNLADMELPPAGRVYVEAYYRSSWLRVDFGTVAATVSPPAERRRLVGVGVGDLVFFRIKVVDSTSPFGRILAAADRIRPIDTDEAEQEVQRIPLLPVQAADLGPEIWRIEFDYQGAPGPVLLVNNRAVPHILDIVKQDAGFFAMVIPAAVRQVLDWLLRVQGLYDPDEDDDVNHLWLRFGARLSGQRPPPPDPDDEESEEVVTQRREWIDQVVVAFCGLYGVVHKFREAFSEEATDAGGSAA